MRRIGCLGMLIILLLGVIAYDRWQIVQLRAEVAAIAGKVHAGKPSKSAPGKKPDLMTSLAEAEKFTRQAQTLLADKRFAEAQAKLDKAMRKLGSANLVSKDIVGDAAQYLGKAKENAVAVFQKAWKDISEEPESKAQSGKSKEKPTHSGN